MANRGQRVPGNRLGSKIRDMELGRRSTGRPAVSQAVSQSATVVTTGPAGTASWYEAWDSEPVVVATPVSKVPVVATLVSVSATGVSVKVTTLNGEALEGVAVHLVAYP